MTIITVMMIIKTTIILIMIAIVMIVLMAISIMVTVTLLLIQVSAAHLKTRHMCWWSNPELYRWITTLMAPDRRTITKQQWSIHQKHDDVIKWKHFPRYWPFVGEIPQSPVNSPHRGQWRGALMFSLIYAWTNGWVRKRVVSGLRPHRAHYDLIIMIYPYFTGYSQIHF